MSVIGLVREDLFPFASGRCDGMAFWGHSGSLHAGWRTWKDKLGRGNALRLFNGQWIPELAGNPRATEPDRLPDSPLTHAALFQLSAPATELKYLYLHPRSTDGIPQNEVRDLTLAALSALDRPGCRRIAMNGIHGIGGGTQISPTDRENAKIMVAAVRDWFASNRGVEEVYLVDLGDSFLNAVAQAG